MPSLIFVTQVVDPDDPVLGFVVPQLRALARSCDRLIVVANEVRSVPDDLAATVEVVSLGKERGYGRLHRIGRYLSVLNRLTREPIDALYLHMCPEYLNAAAPLARLRSIPMLFWYVHSAHHAGVRMAGRLADVIVTTFPGSYPAALSKVRAIGHAIDIERFEPSPLPVSEGLRLAAIGRTSSAKKLDVLLRAVASCRAAGVDVRLRIVGSTTTEPEREYRAAMEAMVTELSLQDAVTMELQRPQAELPAVLADVDALVNCAIAGTADKVVFEAMSAARPVLVSNPVFGPMVSGLPLELAFPEGDSVALEHRIRGLAAAPRDTLEQVGRQLRERVAEDHSLEHWAAAVVGIVRELSGGNSSGKGARWDRSAS